MDDERYQSICSELDLLISHGARMSFGLANKPAPLDREFYSDRIFSKLLSHAITLRRIVPTGLTPKEEGGTELWDLSSTCALARALIESYDSLFYVAVDSITDEEREFRFLLWELHAEERRENKLNLIGSKHPRLLEITKEIETLRERVLGHDYYDKLDKNIKTKISNKRTPAFYLSHSERNKRASINHDYYNSCIMFLSSHVHTLPFSIQQLVEFRAGDKNSLQLISLPIQYAVGFLAKGIQGMEVIFDQRLPEKNKETADLCTIWSGILSDGITNIG